MKRIDDGYQTLITFSASGSVAFYQKEVTPPGMDGGGSVDITTMLNTRYRTMNPKHLMTLTDMKLTAAYDPVVYTSILAMLQMNQQITVTFPDGSTVQFWGYIDKFIPGALVEGQQPTAEVTIVPTNHDNTVPLPLEAAPTVVA